MPTGTSMGGRKYGFIGSKQRESLLYGNVTWMGVRTYSPHAGRFLQTDPVLGGSANTYDYTNQDPVNVYDLDGRCPWCLVALAIAAELGTAAAIDVAAIAVADAAAEAAAMAAVRTAGPKILAQLRKAPKRQMKGKGAYERVLNADGTKRLPGSKKYDGYNIKLERHAKGKRHDTTHMRFTVYKTGERGSKPVSVQIFKHADGHWYADNSGTGPFTQAGPLTSTRLW